VTSRNEAAAIKIEQIRNNTKIQIEALKVKYAIPDAIKTASGFIAIGALCSLALLIIVIECIKWHSARKSSKKKSRLSFFLFFFYLYERSGKKKLITSGK
jgi:hypothetical protein